MKVIKKTGLVPVRSNDSAEIFGVTPETARIEVARGNYVLVDIPEDYETEEVDGPEVIVVPNSNEDDAVINIPEKWQELHHLKKVKLAKELYPDYTPETDDKKWTADLADRKIQEEVDRRTADVPLV